MKIIQIFFEFLSQLGETNSSQKLKPNRYILISFVLLFASCDSGKNITPYVLPKKEFKTTMSYGEFINTISFLFITDDSGSMDSHRKHLADNITLFLEPLLDNYPHYNYNFAVTSAGIKENQLPFLFVDAQFIESECSISPSLLTRNSQLGPYFSYEGSSQISRSDLTCALSKNIEHKRNLGSENFFKPIQYIVEKADQKFKSAFFGKEKILILFFISDAAGEEYIKRIAGKDPSATARSMIDEVLKQLKKFKVKERNLRAYAVIPPKQRNFGCNLDDTTRAAGYIAPVHVHSLVEKMEGVSLSICDTAWGKYLTDVSDNLLQSIPSKTVYIEEVPKIETIEVFFNNKKVPENPDTGWSVEIEKLAIHFGPNFDLSYYKTDSKFNSADDVLVRYQPMNLDILQNSE